MANEIFYSALFARKVKSLKKRHSSLISDLKALEESLVDNPKQGDDLGGGLYKVRLAIKSKHKGKSGGYRVITYLISQSTGSVSINMLTIYDKGEESSVDKKYLLKLLKELF